MSSIAPFQFPLYGVGPNAELPAVAPVPRVHVIGIHAGTPAGNEVLARMQPQMARAVKRLRQYYYTGSVPTMKHKVVDPLFTLYYIMDQGQELIMVEPRPSGQPYTEPVPEGPCRFILIEHTYQQDREVYAYEVPDIVAGEVVYSLRPGPFETLAAQTDAHTLFSRQEVMRGPLAGEHVGVTLGDTPLSGVNWENFRITTSAYDNSFTSVIFGTYEELAPMFRWWRETVTSQVFPTAKADALYLPSVDTFPPSAYDIGTFVSQRTTNQITVVDVAKMRKQNGDFLEVRCTGYWDALEVHYSPVIDFAYGPSKSYYDMVLPEVGTPSPHNVVTTVTRVWAPDDAPADRIRNLLSPPVVGTVLRYDPAYVTSLNVRLASVAYRQVVAARQNGTARPFPAAVGDPPTFIDQGYPPTVLPWGEELGTLQYNCRTGAFAFKAPLAVERL